MRVNDNNLEAQQWTTQTGPNVNPVPADAFVASLLPSGVLSVTNVSTKRMGGALVTCKRPVPAIPGIALPYLGMDMMAYVSSFDLANLGRWELDLKVCLTGAPNSITPIPNVPNFSSQLNRTTGQWQIDGDPPGWLDTGFTPTITPDVWFPISFRYFIDAAAKKFSILSTQWGDQKFSVPAAMQNVPFQVTNWQPVAALQLQMEVFNPGSATTLYDNVVLSWADAAF